MLLTVLAFALVVLKPTKSANNTMSRQFTRLKNTFLVFLAIRVEVSTFTIRQSLRKLAFIPNSGSILSKQNPQTFT